MWFFCCKFVAWISKTQSRSGRVALELFESSAGWQLWGISDWMWDRKLLWKFHLALEKSQNLGFSDLEPQVLNGIFLKTALNRHSYQVISQCTTYEMKAMVSGCCSVPKYRKSKWEINHFHPWLCFACPQCIEMLLTQMPSCLKRRNAAIIVSTFLLDMSK